MPGPWGNGPNYGAYCGQIELSSSGDTLVTENTVLPHPTGPGSNNGIMLYQAGDRGVGPLGPRILRNVSIVGNTIITGSCGSRR